MTRRRALSLTLSLALTALALAGAAHAADDLFIEGEEYEAYGSHNIGGLGITSAFCSGASGYLAASGLDVPGEWILLKVTFPEDGCYSSQIAYQSGYSKKVKVALRIVEGGGYGHVMARDHWFTEGWGFG